MALVPDAGNLPEVEQAVPGATLERGTGVTLAGWGAAASFIALALPPRVYGHEPSLSLAQTAHIPLFLIWGAAVCVLALEGLRELEFRFSRRVWRIRGLAFVGSAVLAAPVIVQLSLTGRWYWPAFASSTNYDINLPVTACLNALFMAGRLIALVTLLRLALARVPEPALRRPLVADTLSVTIASLVLHVSPPRYGSAFFGLAALFTISSMAFTVLWVIALEDLSRRRTAVRGVAAAIGVAILVALTLVYRMPVPFSRAGTLSLPLPPATGVSLLLGVGLVSTAAALAAGDLMVGWTAAVRSIQTRLLLVSLVAAGIGYSLSRLPLYLSVEGAYEGFGDLTTNAYKLLFSFLVVWTFALAFARGLSRSLRQSASALASIRAGNLEVKLDEAGQDEMSEVARTFNTLVMQLRQVEFLEKINDDLRQRSTQLQDAIKALGAAQAELVRAERMASVATLVRGIAHELNNPIGFIAGNMGPLERYCEFLVKVANELADGKARDPREIDALTQLAPTKDLRFVAEDLKRLTSDVAEGARRAKLIISDLQSLTTTSQRGVEEVDLHHVVRQSLSLLAPRLNSAIRVETDLQPVPRLTARAGQLEQVVVNLVDNAIRAVSDSGVIRIRVEKDDSKVRLAVKDSGVGMTDDVRRQACEPFFTTRAAGEGSGLGLAIVASIVRGHRGTLDISSAPGQGTEVTVLLPLREEETAAVPR